MCCPKGEPLVPLWCLATLDFILQYFHFSIFSYLLFSEGEIVWQTDVLPKRWTWGASLWLWCLAIYFHLCPRPPPGVRQSRKSEKLSSRKSETGKASHSPIVWPDDPYTRFLGVKFLKSLTTPAISMHRHAIQNDATKQKQRSTKNKELKEKMQCLATPSSHNSDIPFD